MEFEDLDPFSRRLDSWPYEYTIEYPLEELTPLRACIQPQESSGVNPYICILGINRQSKEIEDELPRKKYVLRILH